MRLLAPALLLLLGACSAPSVERGPSPKRNDRSLSILVQPLGEVQRTVIDSVSAALSKEHDAAVIVAKQRDLPAAAYTTQHTPRYRADTLIAWLRSIKPDSVDLIVGLTEPDISITKYDEDGSIKDPEWKYRDFGIFGLGYVGGPSCVISMFRLGDGPRSFDRLKKIAVHEVGHNRSLPHCADTTCVMRDAVERIRTIDAASPSFCAACRMKLRAY